MAKTTWKIDPAHSEIGFSVRHMMITNVRGTFQEFSAEVTTEDDNIFTADVDFTAKTASINTGVADRDTHLKSDDFFNSEKYPDIRFRGNKIKKKSDTEFTLTGDLTIRDVTKPIDLQVEFGGIVTDPYGQTKAGFTITGTLKRSGFNLKWNVVTEAGSIVVADDIKIACDVQLIKQS